MSNFFDMHKKRSGTAPAATPDHDDYGSIHLSQYAEHYKSSNILECQIAPAEMMYAEYLINQAIPAVPAIPETFASAVFATSKIADTSACLALDPAPIAQSQEPIAISEFTKTDESLTPEASEIFANSATSVNSACLALDPAPMSPELPEPTLMLQLSGSIQEVLD